MLGEVTYSPTMVDFLNSFVPWIVIALILGMLLFLEFGYLYGLRAVRRRPELAGSYSGAIEASIFALLGLLMAFTFGAAQSRMDQRRQLIIEETNNIGTAYLRLDLLPSDAQPELRRLFREYLDARIAVYKAIPNFPKVFRELQVSEDLQKKIWSAAIAGLSSGASGSAPILVLPALNAMIDVTTTRTTMAKTHTPAAVFGLLFLLALLSASVAGYEMSKSPTRNWFHRLAFVAIVSMTFYIILDLEFPRRGLIRLDAFDQILIDLRQSMDSPPPK